MRLFFTVMLFMLMTPGCASEAKRDRMLHDHPDCSLTDDDELICPSPFGQRENLSEIDVD
jgi:hypothetical protein